MLFTVRFPKEVLAPYGLTCPEPLTGLGQLVAVAGPNGGGKSRLLRALRNVIAVASGNLASIAGLRHELASLTKRAASAGLNDAQRQRKDEVARHISTFESLEELTAAGPSPIAHPLTVVELTYDLKSEPTDPATTVPTEADRLSNNTAAAGFGNAYVGMHAFVQRVARDLFNAQHPATASMPNVAAQAASAEKFATVVEVLLAKKLTWQVDADGHTVAHLGGRRFRPEELSAGERILMTWAIILHRQEQPLAGSIVLIDEPENHLHPDMCIQALDRLRSGILGEQGQIWIATHSVPLIAWAGLPSLYLAKDNTIAFSRPLEVVETLLGGKDGRDRLREFLATADALALANFASECLLPAGVAHHVDGDRQTTQCAELVRARLEQGGGVRILDYGAGHARLAAALAHAFGQPGVGTKELEYFAFDREPHDDAERARNIERAKASGLSAEEVASLDHLRGKIHVAVMCNVLHEMPVTQWLDVFRQVEGLLAPEGLLALLEDQRPSVGELPHRAGFVILDVGEATGLFGAASGAGTTTSDGRLTCVQITRAQLGQASAERIHGALDGVRQRALGELRRLRALPESARTFETGRLHALYAMLHVNAVLALQELPAAERRDKAHA